MFLLRLRLNHQGLHSVHLWRTLLHFGAISLGMIGIFAATDRGAIGQTPLTNNSSIVLNGISPIRVGATIAEAEVATGMRFRQTSSVGQTPEWQCTYYAPVNGPEGLSFMVVNNEIVRVDVSRNSQIETRSGAGIGDSENFILSLYPGKIEVSPHPYLSDKQRNGHYLTYVPQDAVDRDYRLIFETVDGSVVQFRSGFRDAVERIEGCL